MTETLFGTEVPASQNNDSTPYTLGTRFTPLVVGQVTHLRFPRPETGMTGMVGFILWRNLDQTQLAYEEVDGATLVDGWNDIELTSPVELTVGEFYTTSYYTPNKYVSTAGYSWPKTSTNGNLESSAPGGYFSGEFEPSYPTDTFNNGCYFADVVFEPTGIGPAEGSAALGLGLAVAAAGAADAEGSAALGLGFAVAAAGGAPARGAVNLGLNLAPAGAGARDSRGSAALGLDLSLSTSGARAAAGSSASGLNLAVAARGSDGEAGRPVTAWPYGTREPSSYPWTPRPVKSFTGEVG